MVRSSHPISIAGLDGGQVLRLARAAAGRWRGRSPIAGEDLAQLAALAICRAATRHDAARMPWPGFAALIARNAITRALRDERIRRHAALPAELLAPDPADPDAEASAAAILARLSDAEADALVLHLGLDGGDGRGYSAVGHALGISRDAAESRCRRALARIRALGLGHATLF